MNAAYVIKQNIKVLIKPTVKAPVVQIQFGPLQGRVSTSRDGRKYCQYLGIPYAAPPVGELRFQPPQPWTASWPDIRDATKDGAKALQFDALSKKVIGDEDCLFLNVHTPTLVQDANIPVLVWFHGGSFIIGSGNDYKPDYFMEHAVVVVTVNYRLGCFGFMDTGDGVVRGNMGLKDQVMALRWVKENIASFGGNPNDVTIAGESAGGASVHFHLLSPMSRGLFHKAISQSGLATLPFAIHPVPGKLVKRFAEMLNCPHQNNSQEMVQWMKGLDAGTLAAVPLGMFDNFRPTIEMEFGDGKTMISSPPMDIIESGNYNHVPFIAGINSGEGLLLATPAVTNKEVTQKLPTAWGETLAPFLLYQDDFDHSILDHSQHLYDCSDFDSANPLNHMQSFTNLFSDRIWYHGFNRAMTAHSVTSNAPLYLYYYDYHGEYQLADMVLAISSSTSPIWEFVKIKAAKFFKEKIKKEELEKYGCCHGDGLSMQWYCPSMCYVPRKSRDYNTSKEIVRSLMEFIKMDPRETKPITYFGQEWRPQEPKRCLEYMHICKEDPKLIQEPFAHRLDFWKDIGL